MPPATLKAFYWMHTHTHTHISTRADWCGHYSIARLVWSPVGFFCLLSAHYTTHTHIQHWYCRQKTTLMIEADIFWTHWRAPSSYQCFQNRPIHSFWFGSDRFSFGTCRSCLVTTKNSADWQHAPACEPPLCWLESCEMIQHWTKHTKCEVCNERSNAPLPLEWCQWHTHTHSLSYNTHIERIFRSQISLFDWFGSVPFAIKLHVAYHTIPCLFVQPFSQSMDHKQQTTTCAHSQQTSNQSWLLSPNRTQHWYEFRSIRPLPSMYTMHSPSQGYSSKLWYH